MTIRRVCWGTDSKCIIKPTYCTSSNLWIVFMIFVSNKYYERLCVTMTSYRSIVATLSTIYFISLVNTTRISNIECCIDCNMQPRTINFLELSDQYFVPPQSDCNPYSDPNDGLDPCGDLLLLPQPPNKTINGCQTIDFAWKRPYYIVGRPMFFTIIGEELQTIIVNSSSLTLLCGASKRYCIPLRSTTSSNAACFEIDRIDSFGSFLLSWRVIELHNISFSVLQHLQCHYLMVHLRIRRNFSIARIMRIFCVSTMHPLICFIHLVSNVVFG